MSQIEKVFLYRVYCKLVEIAGMRSTITLEALVTQCGMPFEADGMADVVYKYLDSITENEASHGRPMLTAVITKQDQKPTQAWLKKHVAATRKITMAEATAILKQYNNNEKIELWKTELTKVYNQWHIPMGSLTA